MIGIATRGYWGTTDLVGGPPVAGASATGNTTTWTAVRRQMATTIKATDPTNITTAKYRLTETEAPDFRTHCEQNPQSVFREYDIEWISGEMQGIQNRQVELWFVEAELLMAYPHHWGVYETKRQTHVRNERQLRALANEDRNVIDKAIGIRGASNYVAAQRSCTVGTVEFEELNGVTLMALPLTVTYFLSSS